VCILAVKKIMAGFDMDRTIPLWDSEVWSLVPWGSDPRMTALARSSSNCKQQTCPLVREGAPHQQTRNCLTEIKLRSWAPDGGLTPRQTYWLTVGRNVNLTLTLRVGSWSNELVARQLPAGRNVSTEAEDIVVIRHQATTVEDKANWEDYVCCGYSDLWSVWLSESVLVICSYVL
jgi:hypothetical protein